MWKNYCFIFWLNLLWGETIIFFWLNLLNLYTTYTKLIKKRKLPLWGFHVIARCWSHHSGNQNKVAWKQCSRETFWNENPIWPFLRGGGGFCVSLIWTSPRISVTLLLTEYLILFWILSFESYIRETMMREKIYF